MKKEKMEVNICPKCKKIVEAAEYFSKDGLSDWRVESIGITIACSKCGYSGLPIQISVKDIKKIEKIR